MAAVSCLPTLWGYRMRMGMVLRVGAYTGAYVNSPHGEFCDTFGRTLPIRPVKPGHVEGELGL